MLDSGITPLGLIDEIGGNGVKILENLNLEYHCDCSRERFLGPLLSIGEEELEEILNERGNIEVRCDFCNRLYHYCRSEVK